MSKQQKIWLSVFLGMFIIPEFLWGGVLGLGQLNSSVDSHLFMTIISFTEFLGLLFSSIAFFKMKGGIYKNIIGVLLLTLGIQAFYIFYLLFATLNASFP